MRPGEPVAPSENSTGPFPPVASRQSRGALLCVSAKSPEIWFAKGHCVSTFPPIPAEVCRRREPGYPNVTLKQSPAHEPRGMLFEVKP